MNEADILALTYTDSCTVYRPFKKLKDNGESTFENGLEGNKVYEDIPCALSSPSGGKLQQSSSTAKISTDYLLFVRPEINILPNDTVSVIRLGKQIILTAGLADRQPSHNNVPMKLRKEHA